MTKNTGYNVAAIRELLLTAFTAEELYRFCLDRPTFRSLHAEFGPSMGLDDMVDRVIDYCRTRLLFDELLTEIRLVRPRRYVRHEPYTSISVPPPLPTLFTMKPSPTLSRLLIVVVSFAICICVMLIVVWWALKLPPFEPTHTPNYMYEDEEPVRLDLRLNANCEAGCIRIAPPDWQPQIRERAIVADPSDFMVQNYGERRVIWSFFEEQLMPDESYLIPSCGGNTAIELGVANLAGDEWIRFETGIFAEIIQFGEYEGTPHMFELIPEGGGFFLPYRLGLSRANAGGELLAEPVDPSEFGYSDAPPLPDFFTLQPGEEEWFSIKPICREAGVYTVRLGIAYTYRGLEQVLWSDAEVVIANPGRAYDWHLFVTGHAALNGLVEWDTSEADYRVVSTSTVDAWVIE